MTRFGCQYSPPSTVFDDISPGITVRRRITDNRHIYLRAQECECPFVVPLPVHFRIRSATFSGHRWFSQGRFALTIRSDDKSRRSRHDCQAQSIEDRRCTRVQQGSSDDSKVKMRRAWLQRKFEPKFETGSLISIFRVRNLRNLQPARPVNLADRYSAGVSRNRPLSSTGPDRASS